MAYNDYEEYNDNYENEDNYYEEPDNYEESKDYVEILDNEYTDTPDFSTYGKIEMDYIEAGRQLVRLEIVRDEVASTITDAIGAIQKLAGLVGCSCSISVGDVVENNLNANVRAINERMNYEIEGYRKLATDIGADINELNNVVADVVMNNSKEYQTALKKSRLYDKEFVYYNQNDYGDARYGSSTIAISGCGPTSAAMVLSSLLGEEITPQEMCDYSSSNGHLVVGGTEDAFFDDAFADYGVSYVKEEQTEENIIASLEEGNYIIAHVGPSAFTSNGHFIVLEGLDEYGNIIVADPYSRERSSTAWLPSYIADIRRGQGMYSVSL